MAHTYSHLFRLPTTGLRFFTVYGPWGRPDMAAYPLHEGDPGRRADQRLQRRQDAPRLHLRRGRRRGGRARRWTPSRSRTRPGPATTRIPATSNAPFRIFNIGNSEPVELDHFIAVLERLLGKKAIRNDLPMQPGDVLSTSADTSDLEAATGFRPQTSIEDGLASFVAWYRGYYGA